MLFALTCRQDKVHRLLPSSRRGGEVQWRVHSRRGLYTIILCSQLTTALIDIAGITRHGPIIIVVKLVRFVMSVNTRFS